MVSVFEDGTVTEVVVLVDALGAICTFTLLYDADVDGRTVEVEVEVLSDEDDDRVVDT